MTLTFDEYQDAAHSTALYPQDIKYAYVGLGLAGEAGEVANLLKKVYRDNDGLMSVEIRDKLIDELADCQWYIAEACTIIGIPLSDLAQRNIDKLATRKARGTLHGSGDNR